MDFREYDTRLAAYAVIVDDQERVLLASWNESSEPQWTMLGGGVELDETPAEGAVRELREETGYDVELRHEVNGTTDEARWIPLSEVSSLPRVSLVDAALALLPVRRGA